MGQSDVSRDLCRAIHRVAPGMVSPQRPHPERVPQEAGLQVCLRVIRNAEAELRHAFSVHDDDVTHVPGATLRSPQVTVRMTFGRRTSPCRDTSKGTTTCAVQRATVHDRILTNQTSPGFHRLFIRGARELHALRITCGSEPSFGGKLYS